MTDQPTPQPVEQPPLVVNVATAGPDDRLAALYAAYPGAKAKKEAAEAELKAITDGIKAELTAKSPDLAQTPKFELRGPGGTPLALRWQITERFDTSRFKKEQPGVYDSYKKPGGSWVLAPIKGGE